jgi:hypothetical protein
MDLSLKRYSTFKGVSSKGWEYVNDAADYNQAITRAGIELDPARIQERIVKIVYPDMRYLLTSTGPCTTPGCTGSRGTSKLNGRWHDSDQERTCR